MRIVSLYIVSICMLCGFSSPNDEKPTIIYVYDPMCGWCYGFSNIMMQYQQKYPDQFDYEIISGGMVVGKNEGYIQNDLAAYIEKAYPYVEQTSGVRYGTDFIEQLKTRQLWLSSSVPSQALETYKKYNYNNAFQFASAMQKAFFYDGLDVRDTLIYQKLAIQFGIQPDEFIRKMFSDEMVKETQMGYETATNYGVSGYPTVIFQYNGKYHLVAKGYTDINSFERAIQRLYK